MKAPHPASDTLAAQVRALAVPAEPTPCQSPASVSPRRWRSADLFGPAQEIEIEHGQSVYRMRLAALGKLILTK